MEKQAGWLFGTLECRLTIVNNSAADSIDPAFPRWPHQFVTKAAIYDIRFNTLQVIGVAGHGAGDG